MKRLAVAFVLSCVSLTAQASAQEPVRTTEPLISAGEITPTTEMWLYQQELRRYENPKTAIRANAEFRAAQRRLRMETLKWYGINPHRPAPNGRPHNLNWAARPVNPAYTNAPGTGTVILQADNGSSTSRY